ncbi:hypothetical protein CTI12_AA222160 [Artemisia annua]|uniref:Uncharacterized protein n=1 Tax=Artemisia annua TaxID=35608 RepID=A0A2U1NUW1_ARTAN|nr:hypothetical protein CTI12_AA222160 [Artemisia annua]
MALLRSKLINSKPSDQSPSSTSNSNAIKWKRKAKERKLEIIRLQHDLLQFQDGMHNEMLTGGASCKCYFFDNLGELRPNDDISGGDGGRFTDVLRRRFLRQVRLKERRKRRSEGSTRRLYLSENNDEVTEQLRASVDFLVDLCDNISNPDDANFANWSHQAVDFILDSTKSIFSKGNITEQVEGIIGSLSLRLVRKMCGTSHGDEAQQIHTDAQFHVQHLLRKLGSEPCIGQRVILAVSQRISLLAENLLFLDPFDSTFPEIHSSLYIFLHGSINMHLDMAIRQFLDNHKDPAYRVFGIRLPDKLVKDRWIRNRLFLGKNDGNYIEISSGSRTEFELFEEWVTSILHARKGLHLLENRCGLYSIYMDRVIGLIAKLVGQAASLQKLNPNVLQNLFC